MPKKGLWNGLEMNSFLPHRKKTKNLCVLCGKKKLTHRRIEHIEKSYVSM